LPEIAEEVGQIWRDTAHFKGVQLLFLSVGVHENPRNGFSAFDALMDLLEAQGIPRDEIVNSRDDLKTKKAEARIHQGLRAGRYRVAIFSDEKGGTGLNIAEKLVALHDVSLPWRPSDIEQRHGRIIRQVSTAKDFKRRIITWISKRSFASRILQLLEAKAAMIESIMLGTETARTVDDIDDMAISFAEMKALSTGDDSILCEAQITSELRKFESLENVYHGTKRRLTRHVKNLTGYIDTGEQRVCSIKADIAKRDAMNTGGFVINGYEVSEDEAKKRIKTSIAELRHGGGGTFVEYAGFKARLDYSGYEKEWTVDVDTTTSKSFVLGKLAPGSILSRIKARVDNLDNDLEWSARRVERDKRDKVEALDQLKKPFEHSEMVLRLERLQSSIREELSKPKHHRDQAVVDMVMKDFEGIKSAETDTSKSDGRQRDKAKSVVAQIMDAAPSIENPSAHATKPAQQVEAAPEMAVPVVNLAEKRKAGKIKQKPENRQLDMFDLLEAAS